MGREDCPFGLGVCLAEEFQSDPEHCAWISRNRGRGKERERERERQGTQDV